MPAGGGSAVRAGRAYVELFADQSALAKGLRQAEYKLRRWGRNISNIGRTLTKAGLAATAPFALSVRIFTKFSDAMLMVKGISGAVGDQFDMLTEKAKLLGRTTSFTASEVASGMVSLARAGFSPEEIDVAIASMLDLARATGTDLAVAADIAANSLRTFGLDASELTRVADVMVATANNSTQTLEDLGQSMKFAAPIAQELGLSIEDTAKSLGALATFGIKGSMAGTSLRRLTVALAESDVQETLHGIGVEAKDMAGNLRNPADILLELGKAMGSMPSGERLALAKDLFGLRGMGAALKLSKDIAPSIQRMYQAIDNAGGVARRTAAIMDSELGGAFRMLLSALEGLAIAVGDVLAPKLIVIADALKASAAGAAAFVEQNAPLVIGVAALAAGMVPLGASLVVLGSSLSAAATLAGMLATAMAFLATPVGAAVVAIGAATAALLTFTRIGDDVKAFTSDILAPLAQTWNETFAGMARAIDSKNMQQAFAIFKLGLKVELLEIGDMIASAIDEWRVMWDTYKHGPPGLLPGSSARIRSDQVAQAARDAATARMIERAKRLADARQALLEATRQTATSVSTPGLTAGLGGALGRGLGIGAMVANAQQLTSGLGGLARSGLGIVRGALTSETTRQRQGELFTAGGKWLGGLIANADPEGALKALWSAGKSFLSGGDLAKSIGLAPELAGGEARGALTSQAALRLGGIVSLDPAQRAAKAAEKTAQLQEEGNGIMSTIKDLLKKSQLTFVGALPG